MRVIDLSTLSLVGGSGIAETKIPLWSADGTSASTTNTSSYAYCLQDGSTALSNTAGASPRVLFTLSTNIPATQNYAFECTIWTSSASYGVNANIMDLTAATGKPSVYTTSTTATVLRSNQFTLTPGNQFGVSVWLSTAGGTAYISDASLIIFP